jgi:plastocyanin
VTRRLLLVFSVALSLAACDEPGDDDGPDAAPNVTLPAGEIDQECAEVSAAEGAPAPVTMMDTFFDPNCFAVSSTQPVAVTNAGNLDHNFTIQGSELSTDVEPGEDEETDEVGDYVEAGTYKFFCRFHEDQGMVGTVVVE